MEPLAVLIQPARDRHRFLLTLADNRCIAVLALRANVLAFIPTRLPSHGRAHVVRQWRDRTGDHTDTQT